MQILALPGDEPTVVEWMTAASINRDRRFTVAEMTAYHYATRCSELKEFYASRGYFWPCTPKVPCDYCYFVRTL